MAKNLSTRVYKMGRQNLSTSRRQFYQYGSSGMTFKEWKVYDLLVNKEFSQSAAAQRLKISRQAISKTIKRLREIGIFSDNNQEAKRGGMYSTILSTLGTPKKNEDLVKNSIRLHNMEYKIEFISKGQRYDLLRNAHNAVVIDGNTVRLFENSLEVYVRKSFWGRNADEATAQGMEYMIKFFGRLENDLSVVLIKDRKHNIKLVNSHYSEVSNELAKDLNKRREKLSVRGDDGKTWLKIDNSFHLHELETVHPEKSKHDMEKMKFFFDDIRKNDPPTLTELSGVLKEIVGVQRGDFAGVVSRAEEGGAGK
jgi:hypothetical protein